MWRPVFSKGYLISGFFMAGFTNLLLIVSVSFVVSFLLMNTYVYLNSPQSETKQVEQWLDEFQLKHLKKYFKDSGISSLVSCATVENLPQLHPHDEERLQRAARLLQQRLILRQWLYDLGLHHHHNRLVQEDVTSLEDVYWLEDSRARFVLGKDFPTWSAARQALPVSKEDLSSLKAELWSAVVKSSSHQDAWTFGGMLVVSVSVAGLVTLAAMTQPSLAPEAKHSLLQYVTGKYLHTGNTVVRFHWQDPQQVGQTSSFTILFYQRNGQPYPICDTDRLVVEVSEAEGHRRVAALVELGGTEPHSANTAAVKFTVRQAGQYKITILIGNGHINGSPFIKTFLPGPPDPVKTTFVRPSSTVIVTAGTAHSLALEPRDEFNNLCRFPENDDPTLGYTVTIKQIGNNTETSDATWNMDYDRNYGRLMLGLVITKEGCYKVQVLYANMALCNGAFDCVALSVSDAATVQKNVRNHSTWYEAKLLSYQGEKYLKPRKVLVYVSPKQLTIKEFVLKFIPKRLITFRLCPSTKFQFLGDNNQTSFPCFIIDDGCQPKVELMSRERDVIAATFTHFLLKNIGGSETFKDKQDFFYHEVRRFHHKHFHEKLSMKVNREKLLESSLKATKGFSVSDWCRNFEITFQGEQGVDWGGLRREWFQLICGALFDPKNFLFVGFSDSQQALVHPNQKRPSNLKLKFYEFAGRVVGKCLYESALGGGYRQLVRARFTRSFLAQLIGLRVHYKYFEQDDPDLYLSKIKYILEHDVEDMELFFVEEEYDQAGHLNKLIELVPNGSKIRVHNGTKHQYLDALAQYRLATSLKDEIEAFLRGLNDLIPDNLLSIFDENELELLMCGMGEYSVSDFRAHHIINGSSPEFCRVLDWFWAIVCNFTHEEMARLLQFTTGSSQLPPGGFKELSPRFQLTAAPTFGNLPTAHTCFNQLCLPDYESYEHFERALLLAINEGTEGFGMI